MCFESEREKRDRVQSFEITSQRILHEERSGIFHSILPERVLGDLEENVTIQESHQGGVGRIIFGPGRNGRTVRVEVVDKVD